MNLFDVLPLCGVAAGGAVGWWVGDPMSGLAWGAAAAALAWILSGGLDADG